MNSWFIKASLLCVAAGIFIVPATAEEQSYAEHEIKAALIYNFVRFVNWPDENTKDANMPIIIGVVGKYPPCKTFKDIRGKTVRSRPLEIIMWPDYEKIQDANALKKCHLLFICNSEQKNIKNITRLIGNHSILTVGENPTFIKDGGMIRLLKEENKIKFEVHLNRAERSKLKIRSNMLKLATKVIRNK